MRRQEFDYNQSILAANIWQYDRASSFLSILEQKEEWYNSNYKQFWQDWFSKVFDLRIDYDLTNFNHTKVNLFGCTVWAIILNFPLEPILVPREGQKQPWSFEDIGANTPDPIKRQNFGPVQDPATSPWPGGNFTPVSATLGMTILEKVQLLKLVYYRSISNCTIPSINAALADVFKITGMIHIDDNGNSDPITQLPWVEDCQYVDGSGNTPVTKMVLNYNFPYRLRDPFINAITDYDVMPRPSGVKVNLIFPS